MLRLLGKEIEREKGGMKKVCIVMSIYNPKIEYLEKQLKSLDEQEYDNIEVIIWDDNPASNVDSEIFEKNLSRVSYRYIKGDKNLGYGKAFQHLTELAQGEYIAFCDQDDIWLKNKISRMVSEIERENAVLVTSDRAIIDDKDNIVISSCRKENPDICNSWSTGDNITARAVFNTCAIGMNILMRLDIAKKLLPLPDDTAHDKWFTAGASTQGKTVFLEDVLVYYRRHNSNVSGVLTGISSKKDYYSERVEYSYGLANTFVERFPEISDNDRKMILEFANARKQRKILKIWKYRKLSPKVAFFEIVIKFVPDFIFKRILTKM